MAKYKFVKSNDESGNIRTFVFDKADATWQAGQYQKWVLNRISSDDKAKTRWFTIASAPSEGELHISTRVTDSDFKQTLNNLQPGDEIEANDLGGDFTWDDNSEVVFVAGGIGVTPYRSMIVEHDKTNQPINATLLYFGRDENLAFRDEFAEIANRHPEFNIKYIIGEHITAENILNHADDLNDKTLYLSGPEAMVDAVGEELKAKGVNLKQDWFPGYDETTY